MPLHNLKNMFNYIMTSIDKATISNIDSSLKTYQGYIDDVDAVMNKDKDYAGEIYQHVSNASQSSTRISSFLQGLTFSRPIVNDDIVSLDNSYQKFHDNLAESKRVGSNLKNMISKYDAIDASVKNAQKSNTHSVMIAWGMVFLFVLNALFFSIIEDKKELNVFSKFLLFLFMLVILFYSVKNFRFYIERNIQ